MTKKEKEVIEKLLNKTVNPSFYGKLKYLYPYENKKD